MNTLRLIPLALVLLCTACSTPVVETKPAEIHDTGAITLIAHAGSGNKGLLGFKGPVYVHVGLITDSSINPNHWRYVRFAWGSADPAAEATRTGNDEWSYTIPHIRRFFGVKKEEKIISLAVLFRQGNCIDTLCKVLRNADKSDIFIPVQ